MNHWTLSDISEKLRDIDGSTPRVVKFPKRGSSATPLRSSSLHR